MSSLSQIASAPSEEAGTRKFRFWRAIKARDRVSADARGQAERSILAFALSPSAISGPIRQAKAALQRGDFSTAYVLARPLAERGLDVAQLIVGVMHGGGHGVPRDDAEAANWLHRAADQGVPKRRPSSAGCTPRAKGCSRTTPRPRSGSEWPPTRITPPRSRTSVSCMQGVEAWRKTTPRRQSGSAGPPTRDSSRRRPFSA